jgi:hypothetical protein
MKEMMKTRCTKSFKSASSQVQDIVFGSMLMNPLTLPLQREREKERSKVLAVNNWEPSVKQ